MSFDLELTMRAATLLDACRLRSQRLATAESCTGGLIAALLTAIPGSSDVVDAGFVTYSNAAKSRMLDVPPELIRQHGAVSAPVARAMALGALAKSEATMAIAVTGVAGPGGGTPQKPVGLVYCAAAAKTGMMLERKLELGSIGRDGVRLSTVAVAIDMLQTLASADP